MPRPPRFRRSSTLIAYWDDGRLIVHNYLSGTRIVADPALIPFLHDVDAARDAAARGSTAAAKRLAHAIAELERHTLVERDEAPSSRKLKPSRYDDGTARASALASGGWSSWGPLAAAFHFGTKDVAFSTDPGRGERRLARKAKTSPMPAPTKPPRPGMPVTALPAVGQRGEFVDTLLSRRTWREFSRRPVALRDIATLLQLTWGVQRRGVAPGQGPIVLKTSPSGGACHPGEVYLLAVRVDGLEPALYHYQADRHELVMVKRGASAAHIGRYLPGQSWYRPAAALFLMTAVFEREQWRYATPRAYRTVLIDAGHLCQTFCLTASWLGLAPFCSMALADSLVERDLGIDGTAEGVIYAAGVGARRAGRWRPGVPGLRRGRRIRVRNMT